MDMLSFAGCCAAVLLFPFGVDKSQKISCVSLSEVHRLVAFLVIGKWQQRAPRKQSGKRKHELTLAVTGVALQRCNLAEKPSICCFEAIEKRRISTTLLICLENRAKKLPFNYL